MAEATLSSYDALPYPGQAYPQSHPDCLATIATLFGLPAAPAGRCRVLELGCGDGGNLLPMACRLPGSRFTGVDLSARAIAQGASMIARLGLENARLIHADLLEWDGGQEEYDYIIAHGVYTWVPPAVQDRVLAICGAHLAPDGVAFVSYNAYPGSHLRAMVREMMLFRTGQFDDPEAKVAEAQAFLRFLSANTPAGSDLYCAVLKTELDRLSRAKGPYLIHGDLAENQNLVYFHQFASHAAAHGLGYLGEASFHDMQTDQLPAEAAGHLARLAAEGRHIEREQVHDFLTCRRYRQTLLCRAHHELQREPGPGRVADYHVASAAAPEPGDGVAGPEELEKFRTPRGRVASVGLPMAKAALLVLREAWPQAIACHEMVSRAEALCRERWGSAADVSPAGKSRLLAALWKLYSAGIIELHMAAFPLTVEPGARPVADALCRVQAALGTAVTSVRHFTFEMNNAPMRALLPLMDGSRSRETLKAEYARLLGTGGEAPAGGPEEAFEAVLRRFAELALLTR
jgi:SAM-dependent methyltransferase